MNSADFQNRRQFLGTGTLVLLSTGAPAAALEKPATDRQPALRIGLVTDLHHADKATKGTRHYRESLTKLQEAGAVFAEKKTGHVFELGDLIDAADSVKTEQGYLRRVWKDFSGLPGTKHCVLGNHCVDTLTKSEFLGETDQSASFLSFDDGGFHFVILDACFRSDGQPYERRNFQWTDANVPEHELEWLRADLQGNHLPAIVFTHQRLDNAGHHMVRNAAAVRAILEQSGNVKAAFQGHSHKNDHQLLNGIHYTTLVAMVEGSGAANSGYSLLDLHADGTLVLEGFRRQESARL